MIVPTYRTEYDTTALRILQESLPGYHIVPIDCDNQSANIISASGAIHCITKGVGVADPLLIRHQRLTDTYETVNPYPVAAYIRHKSGIASANLFWTTDTAQAWNEVTMADQGDGNWTAAIPAQPANTTIFYYVQGTSNSGKVQVRPIVAPEGWWKFRVLDVNASISAAGGPAIMDVFPNPCVSHVSLRLDRVPGATRILLRDATGRVVKMFNSIRASQDGRVLLDVSSLPVGTYALSVETPEGRTTRYLMKQ